MKEQRKLTTISPEQLSDIFTLQHKILSMLVNRQKVERVFDELCNMVEVLLPNSFAQIMIEDNKGHLRIQNAPSIPKKLWQYFENLRLKQPHKKEGRYFFTVFDNEEGCKFIDGDSESTKRCFCWAIPIMNKEGNVIGDFALFSNEDRVLNKFHAMLLESVANIVSIVLNCKYHNKKLQVLYQAMQSAFEGIIFTDEENKIIEVNKVFEEMYGYKQKEVLGRDPSFLSSGLQNKRFYANMWKSLKKTGHWSGEIVNKRRNGELIHQWTSINVIKVSDSPARYFAIFTDIGELKKAREKTDFLIYHDQLTSLFNKTKLTEIINEGNEYALLHIDVNNFNYIDMAYSFKLGDKLLVKIAEVLNTRFNAIAVFRINSDEFILLYSPDVKLENVILDIQRYFYDNPFEIDGVKFNVSFNYGGAKGKANILENAAFALKLSKQEGKNRYHIFNKAKDEPSKEEKNRFITAHNLIFEAIERDLFRVYFQGIYDNKKKKITKYETLVRIEKEGEIISPFRFLDAAKLSGLLPEITKIVIDKSFQIMSEKTESFSINISEDDLNRAYLPLYLKDRIEKYGIDPKRVIIEVLEGVSASGNYTYLQQFKEIKEMGMSIAIDDFGSEYSNFGRLLEIDTDFLKIDAKYIKHIDTDKKSFEIVKAISAFAKKLDIECVAEFIHSQAVQKKVEEIGIEYSQGFYFSKPRPFD